MKYKIIKLYLIQIENMKVYRFLITLMILVPNIVTLHLHFDAVSFLASLKSKQQALINDVDTLKKDIDDTANTVKDTSDIKEKIKLLEQAVRRQRKVLNKLETDIKIQPSDKEQWTCKAFSEQDKKIISEALNNVDKKLGQTQNSINSLKDQNIPNKNDINDQLIQSQKQAERIKKLFNQQHKDSNDQLKKTSQSNLYASNWVLGKKTLQDLNKQFEDKSKNFNAVNTCPLATPFYNEKQCIACEGQKPYFNFQLKQCQKCETYNAKTHTCPQIKYYTNLNGNKWISKKPQQVQKQVDQSKKVQNARQCPIQTPYFNGIVCISCSQQNQHFDVDSKACISCENYDENTHSCKNLPKSPQFYSNLQNQKWLANNPIHTKILIDQLKTKSTQCPLEKPFFNDKQCITCDDKFYNFDTKTCEACLPNTSFDVNLHACIVPDAAYHQTNPNSANLIYDGISKNQWFSIYKNNQKSENMEDCPQKTPYYDGKSCINCPQTHPFFNMIYRKCQICGKSTKYDNTSKECLTQSGNIGIQRPTLQKLGAGIFAS